MATILCIETATTNCSVALSVNGSVIALKEDNSSQYSHAERLHSFIEQVMVEAGINKNELDAIAVSKGPGSYTGLRIGVSATKGLCYALDKPLISIPTLESLACQVSEPSGIRVTMLDARRMEVYSAVFSSEGKEIRNTKAEVLTSDSFIEFLDKGTVHFIGNGVEKFEKICNHKNFIFVKDKLPSAKEMGHLAELKYNKNLFEDVAYFEPYYLKDFISG
jgi:tRNA threonylcarbamoyladenosine biosynthesis protein TsaB